MPKRHRGNRQVDRNRAQHVQCAVFQAYKTSREGDLQLDNSNAQYMQVFLDESSENIQVLNTVCLKLEQGVGTDEDFATMFRAAHTLKGMSATMGFAKMAQLTHRLEDALGILRSDPSKSNEDILDAFFSSIDALEGFMEDIQNYSAEGDADHSELVAKLEAFVHGTNAVTSAKQQAAPALAEAPVKIDFTVDEQVKPMIESCKAEGLDVAVFKVSLVEGCMMKGPRAIMAVRGIEQFADIVQCKPSTDEIESGVFEGDHLYFVLVLRDSREKVTQVVLNVSEIVGAEFFELDAALASESSNASNPAEQTTNSAHTPKVESKKAPQAVGGEKAKAADRTIRVPVERLDVLMNLLSELVIDKTRLSSIANVIKRPELKEVADRLSRVANDLQSSVMSLRLIPVETLFQRFPRMIRDLSKSLNKEIKLEMSGLETEFDRTVIDEMGEALVHLIRNAADHGLESTEERIRAGKPAEGTISLRAYAAGQHVFIEVSDNGGGVNTEAVRARAISKGVVSQTQGEAMGEQQVWGLLFESGFSTAEKVSDISGRGVGLDAVKNKVQSLGGRIHIESNRGVGTTFRIQLPLTLSILQALLIQVSGDTYAIPLGSVEEVVFAGDSEFRTVHGTRVLSYRDKLVPILDAGDWLSGSPVIQDTDCSLVICKEGEHRLAVAVDKLLGQQEVVNKSLGTYLKSVQEFSGATILGDGSIALIIDVHNWMTNK